MGDIGDYWREHKEYQKEQEAKFWASPQGQAKMKRKAKQVARRISRAEEFAKVNQLTYKQFESDSVGHFRVQNSTTGKFVDWWSTGTLRNIDNTYRDVGVNDINLLAELEKLK